MPRLVFTAYHFMGAADFDLTSAANQEMPAIRAKDGARGEWFAICSFHLNGHGYERPPVFRLVAHGIDVWLALGRGAGIELQYSGEGGCLGGCHSVEAVFWPRV